MPSPFILRFQEPCEAASTTVAGTQTLTNVRAEQMDSDPDRPKHSGFGAPCAVGTRTKTAVKAEHSDEDRGQHLVSALPTAKFHPHLGTKTFTKVHAEQADQDPGRHQFHAIPQCSLS